MKVLKKIFDPVLWLNLLGMAVAIVLLILGVHYGLNFYTNHGEEITVPDINHKAYEDAYDILDDLGLEAVVVDTSYVRTLPPGCVLEQTPKPGAVVKSGRIIYLTSMLRPSLPCRCPTSSTTLRSATPRPSS